jgi:hypothetical protein
MPIYIFNAKKEFWNASIREFQKEPYVIRSATEAQMEIRMAGRKDDTSDMLHFDEQFQEQAYNHIMNMKITKQHLKVLKDMNGCLR